MFLQPLPIVLKQEFRLHLGEIGVVVDLVVKLELCVNYPAKQVR